MLNVNLELLLSKFNCYEFIEDTHKYLYNGCPVNTSVTSFISKYFPEFDTENISIRYAQKHNMNVEDVRNDWKKKGNISSIAGTIIHSHLENLKRGKRLQLDYSKAKELNLLNEVKERVDILLPKAEKFHYESLNRLFPIKLEYTVGINDKLAGNVDMLCWNEKMQELQIWDYKNTKGIVTENNYNQFCYAPFNMLCDCNYYHYCMQLNFYKAIIVRQLGLQIGKMYLVSFDYTVPGNDYKLYECLDLQDICMKELDKLDEK